MALPDPQLDDRRFQDLVDEAKSLIPRYCPEWTDHNVSDPGVTLIELFAWMTDLALYRLNRLPEKAHLRFMSLLGVTPREPVAARAPLTFWLSAPAGSETTIPRGTEVATVRTTDRPAIVFSTDEDLQLEPADLRACLLSSNDTDFLDQTEVLLSDDAGLRAFQDQPLPGDAVYFGFDNDISNHTIRMALECTVQGVGIDPRDPPLVWEAWCGTSGGWQPVQVDENTTGGLNMEGEVVMRLPGSMDTRANGGVEAHWLRVRVVQPRPGQDGYASSPVIMGATAETIGGTVLATHSTIVTNELPGRATGEPGQELRLLQTPILPLAPDEYLEVHEGEGWERWECVPTFIDSGPDDPHYTLDRASGIIQFGPTIREPNGTERPYGRTPKPGSGIRFVRYRHGGGVEGNVGANTLTVLKSSIPYVARVTNLRAASGGLDAETLESARLRTPAILRTRDRAVAPADYEFLALEASRRIARVKCIQVRGDGRGASAPPGTVELLVVPVVPPGRERTVENLASPPDLQAEVAAHLDERRLLATRLDVRDPRYLNVRIEATVVPRRDANPDTVRTAVDRGLRRYLDPLLGGSDGTGWAFGRDLSLAEVQSFIQRVDGVDFVEDVTLYQVDLSTGQERAAGRQIPVAEDVLILPLANDISLREPRR